MACLLGALAFVSPVVGWCQESYEANPGLISVGGFVVFFNTTGPLSYATLTPGDRPKQTVSLGPVTGRGCQYGVSIPILANSSITRISGAAGRGGYEKALLDIRERWPELKGLYDVMVDVHLRSVLTIFSRRCTEVTAKGFK